MEKDFLTVVDLFAGGGGMSAGFRKAGFRLAAAFESWEPAARCYEANFRHPVFRADLSDVKTAERLIAPFSPALIIGGPPCQDFSCAGKRVESRQADLTMAFCKIVCRIRPA
jgi:DNA (cytosine-5)-methyltransferase 1